MLKYNKVFNKKLFFVFFATSLILLSQIVNAGNPPLVPGWSEPELCPLPLPPSEPKLQHDSFIKNDLQDADTSIDWYEEECRKRKRLEADNEAVLPTIVGVLTHQSQVFRWDL